MKASDTLSLNAISCSVYRLNRRIDPRFEKAESISRSSSQSSFTSHARNFAVEDDFCFLKLDAPLDFLTCCGYTRNSISATRNVERVSRVPFRSSHDWKVEGLESLRMSLFWRRFERSNMENISIGFADTWHWREFIDDIVDQGYYIILQWNLIVSIVCYLLETFRRTFKNPINLIPLVSFLIFFETRIWRERAAYHRITNCLI